MNIFPYIDLKVEEVFPCKQLVSQKLLAVDS